MDNISMRFLGLGRSPRHVAFIMDGNRRFARQNGLPVRDGHQLGYENMERVIRASRHLNIQSISFFALGVDNLKRGEEEVTNLMHLFKKVLQRWTQPDGLAHELQLRINHFGERELLGDDVLKVLDDTLPMTHGYTMGHVNLFFAYSSMMEIKHGLQAAIHAGPTGFSKGLYTRDEPPVDLLVRTSGTSRLSDFMLWQCSVDTELMFVNYYWPELDTWRLILVILQWRVSITRPQIAGLVVAGLLRPLLALRN